jgi:hypothetical protein
VGSDDAGGGTFVGPATEGGSAQSLAVQIQQNDLAVTVVTVGCSGACADVEAVASGGTPPYTFAWDDGSSLAKRTLCPRSDTSYAVTATDTGTTGELGQAPQTARASVTADVIACPEGATDGGAPDGGDAAGSVACDLDGSLPATTSWTVEVDALGSQRDLAGGASLPAGRYRAQWVGGCMRYAVGGPMFGWDVNDPPPAVFPGPFGTSTTDPGDCVLVSGGTVVTALPGVTGFGTSDYASCVAHVGTTAPVEFDFAGGKLGALANDFGAGDNVNGESAGGVSPTFRITLLAACR